MSVWSWLKGFIGGTEQPLSSLNNPDKDRLVALVLLLRQVRELDAPALADLAHRNGSGTRFTVGAAYQFRY